MTPLLSVIIPTFNRSSFLSEMLASVLRMKGVTMEVIVCDDASTDQTAEMARRWMNEYGCIRYLRNDKNCGCGYSRHRAYSLARGKYIVFADDDDYYTDADFYQKVIGILNNDERLAFCGANVAISRGDSGGVQSQRMAFQGRFNGFDYLLNGLTRGGKPISTFSTVFRKEVLEKAGFSEMKMMNDASIYMRALLYGDAYILEDEVGVYSLHEGNLSKHLTGDFILANLKEKGWVFDKSFDMGNPLPKRWITEQFDRTVFYYLSSSRASWGEIYRIHTYGRSRQLCRVSDLLKWIITNELWRMRRALRGG